MTGMSEQTVIRGTQKPLLGKPSRTSDPDRRCAEEGCTTKLSVYNHTEFCNRHRKRKRPRLRGKFLEEQEGVLPACVQCHKVLRSLEVRGELTYAVQEFQWDGQVHISGPRGTGTLCELE